MNWDKLIEAMRMQGWLVTVEMGIVEVDTWENQPSEMFDNDGHGLARARAFYRCHADSSDAIVID